MRWHAGFRKKVLLRAQISIMEKNQEGIPKDLNVD
jgi:hypothetical protein